MGERFLRIQFALMATPGADVTGLRTVHSHVHALGQCRGVIRELGLTPIVSGDTAGAAREVAEAADPTQAAIAPPLAAQIYGLEVLRDEIEDEDHNTTRFIVLSRDYDEAPRGDGPIVTTFIFNVRNLPAALYKALGGFATNGVNMTKLESYMVDGPLHRDPVPRRGRRPPRRPGRAQRARGAGVLHHRGQGARRLPGRRVPGRVGGRGLLLNQRRRPAPLTRNWRRATGPPARLAAGDRSEADTPVVRRQLARPRTRVPRDTSYAASWRVPREPTPASTGGGGTPASTGSGAGALHDQRSAALALRA